MCELLTAVKRGDEERTRALLECPEFYSFPSWKLGQGIVLMREALKRKHGHIARLLLSKGARVNHNKLGQPTDDPLHLAVTQPGNVGIVEELLRCGAQVNGRNADGRTPLHLAACFEGVTPLELACITANPETLAELLNHGADVNVNTSEGQTILDLAFPDAREGFPFDGLQIQADTDKMLSMLLEHGAKVNAINRNGKTILYRAVEDNRLSTATLLVKCANVNALSFDDVEKCLLTPLQIAVTRGHKAMVQLLIEHHADVNFPCNTNLGGNYTPLHLACSYGRFEIVEILLNHGADVEAKSFEGRTPIFAAVSSRCSKSPKISDDIVRVLVAQGALVNTLDYEGGSILHAAVETKSASLVQLVLELLAEHHCDVRKFANMATIAGGLTPLHIAAAEGCSSEIIDTLLKNGAYVDAAAACKMTPLHFACDNLHPDVVEFLLCNGADVNKQTSGGLTPAHLLLALGHFRTARDRRRSLAALQILLEKGADLKITDDSGNTLPTLAVCGADVNIVKAIFTYRPSADVCRSTLRMAIKQLNRHSFNDRHRAVDEIKMIARELQDYGVTLDEAAVDDVELLNCAAQFGFSEVVKDLLKMGADVTASSGSGLTPLHSAVIGLQEDIVRLLLRAGANVSAKDRTGVCPVGYLERRMEKLKNSIDRGGLLKCFRIAEDLASNGVKLGSSFLIEGIRFKLFDFVSLALNCGSDVNVKADDGFSLLHRSIAWGGDMAIVRLLLDQGALVNATDGQGRTPLHLAALSEDADLIETLVLGFGADVNAKDIMFGSTALHVAAELGHPRAAVALLRCGADVEARTSGDLTALHLAAARPDDSGPSIVRSLLSFGADPLSKSAFMETPASSIYETTPIVVCCQEGGQPESLEALLDHTDLPHDLCCYLVRTFPHLSASSLPAALVRQFLNLDVRRLRPSNCPCLEIVRFGEPLVVSQEIDMMSEMEVVDGLTFCDLITKTKSQLIALARNEALVAKLKCTAVATSSPPATNCTKHSSPKSMELPTSSELGPALTSPSTISSSILKVASPGDSVPYWLTQFPIFSPLLAHKWMEATRRQRLLSDGLVAFNALIVQSVVSLVIKKSSPPAIGSSSFAERLEAVGYRWLVDLLNTNSDESASTHTLISELKKIEFLLPETIVEKIIKKLSNDDLEILALSVAGSS